MPMRWRRLLLMIVVAAGFSGTAMSDTPPSGNEIWFDPVCPSGIVFQHQANVAVVTGVTLSGLSVVATRWSTAGSPPFCVPATVPNARFVLATVSDVVNSAFQTMRECGNFSGASTIVLTSDANGLLSLPPWTAPNVAGTCFVEGRLDEPGTTTQPLIVATVTPPPPTPCLMPSVSFLSGSYDLTIEAGGSVPGLEFQTMVSNAHGSCKPGVDPNLNVSISTMDGAVQCGHFSGASTIQVTSDAVGRLVLPAWTAPATTGTCHITGQVMDANAQQIVTAKVIVTTAKGQSPSGGDVTLSLSSPVATCTLVGQTGFLDPALTEFTVPLPTNVAHPHGLVSFHTDRCGVGQPVTFTVEFPGPRPPTAQWWKYGATPDNYDNRWVPIPATFDGNRVTFTITDGTRGDDDLVRNGSISHLGMLVIPGGMYQDLWWGGSPENGWGMSLVQHADKLFANLYVYDANGNPVWYVMPSGGWNPQHNAFSGALYLPKGSPFHAYDASKFDIGASVGTMSLTFADINNALLEYRISGVSGSKSIHRVLFGPASPPTDQPHADLWWAGTAQNGWGLAMLQQNSTLFGLWFTYDANGNPTWFAMPGGDWVVTDLWRGAIFKGTGSPWVGAAYDASKLHLNDVGTFDLRFIGSNAATFNYSAEGKSGTISLSRIAF